MFQKLLANKHIDFFIGVKYSFFWFYRSVPFEAIERLRSCKDYFIGREITNVLKIAVDSITLELCDSRDYFASSLLLKENRLKFNRDFKERKLLSYLSCPDIS